MILFFGRCVGMALSGDMYIMKKFIHCHGLNYEGHYGPQRTASRVLESDFYWPSIFKDAREFV